MKKLIQVSLIVVIVFLMAQAVVGGPMALASQTHSIEVQRSSFTTVTPVQNVQLLICPAGRGVSCMKPNVGWNS
jgi:hypothetical protein